MYSINIIKTAGGAVHKRNQASDWLWSCDVTEQTTNRLPCVGYVARHVMYSPFFIFIQGNM